MKDQNPMLGELYLVSVPSTAKHWYQDGMVTESEPAGLSHIRPAVHIFKMATKTKPKDVRSLMKEQRNKSKKKIDSPLARYYIYKNLFTIFSLLSSMLQFLDFISHIIIFYSDIYSVIFYTEQSELTQ
jgi:hypothetical protein